MNGKIQFHHEQKSMLKPLAILRQHRAQQHKGAVLYVKVKAVLKWDFTS